MATYLDAILLNTFVMAVVETNSRSDILSKYARGLTISNRRRYLEKISDIGDPYLLPSAELSREVTPPVHCTDIFNYLVLSRSFCTTERFKAFKSLEAYKYFESGFVDLLGSKKTKCNKFVTVGKVSQAMLDTRYC